jgi:hypothetical protein
LFEAAQDGKRHQMSTDDANATSANDVGGAGDLLSPMAGTDSDDVLHHDRDDVVDPPDGWAGVDEFSMSAHEQADGESLNQRLAKRSPTSRRTTWIPATRGASPTSRTPVPMSRQRTLVSTWRRSTVHPKTGFHCFRSSSEQESEERNHGTVK